VVAINRNGWSPSIGFTGRHGPERAVLHLTPGQDADIAAAPDVLALAPPMSALLADKGYDGDEFRGEIVRRGAKPVIPNKSNRVASIASTDAPPKAATSSNAAFAG